MRYTQLLQITALLFMIACSPAHAAFKCVDANGGISYQDKPCAQGQAQSEPVKTPPSQKTLSGKKPKLVEITMGQDLTYVVGIPSDWVVKMSDFGDSPTMTASVKEGKPLSLLMTFSPRKLSQGMDEATVDDLMKVVERGHSNTELEKLISSLKVKLVFSKGAGQLNTYLDKKLVNERTLPEGQFVYTVTGVVVIDGRPITVSIFCNELGTDDYAKALVAVHMLVKENRK